MNNRTCRTVRTGAATAISTYTYNSLNQLVGIAENPPVTITYDADGNRVSKSKGNQTETYQYDRENRLKSVSGAGGTYSYAYDYRSRRVSRTEMGETTKVIFSGGTSVREQKDVAGEWSTTVEYVRGSDRGGGIGGILYSVRPGTGTSFAHYNSRGDITARTDSGGNVGCQAAYEAFGTRTQTDGATIDRQAANTKEEDPTGFLNEGMRYRDLATGVFLTRDPAGFVDGPNLYAYGRQNLWSKFDPEGLFMFGLHDNAGDYFSEVGQVWKGYGQAGGDFVGGIAHTVAHPIQTAQGIGTAVAHPVATAKAVGGAINESWNSGLQGQGRVVGNVLIAVGTAAAPFAEAGEAAAAANAVTRLEEAGEVGTSAARTAEKAAELARKSGACFPAGTLVATPAGELPIETLREGEQVYAFDFERGEVVPRTVLKTYLHFTYCWVDIQAGDETITATRGHRFWVESEQRWIAALELQPGMAARLQDGRSVTITATALRELTQSEPTFNLEVERDHDYFVGASKVLVLNGDIEKVGPHEVGPYEDVGGHHPHQQAARSNNPNYDPQKAVPVKPGTYDHSEISRVQQRMNAQAAKSGAVYNPEAEEAIQRAAMKAGGMAEPEIERVLELSRQQLKTQGALEPSRIPGTPKKGC